MSDTFSAPSKAMLAFEFPRGALEYLAGWLGSGHLAGECAKGDDGPVIVLPGLGTGDFATAMLRTFLNDVGYKAYGWNRGVNTGPKGNFEVFLADLLGDVTKVFTEHGKPVRLIGWSLGGVYARELSKLAPKLIRQVITLGTPFAGTSESTNGAMLFELLSGSKCHKDAGLQRRIAEPPTVPTVSVYSKTDGVVAWQSSLNPDLPHLENIELSDVSHLGMVSNPRVYRALAAKLASAPASAQVFNVDFRRPKLRKAA